MEFKSESPPDPIRSQEFLKMLNTQYNIYFKGIYSQFAEIVRQSSTDYLKKNMELAANIASNQLKKTIEAIREAAKIKLPEMMEHIAQSYQSLTKLAPFEEARNALEQQIATDKEVIAAKYQEALDALRAHQAWNDTAGRYAAIMIEAEWPPPLDIPSSAIPDIIRAYEELPREQFCEELDRAIFNFYDEELFRLSI